MGNKSIENYNNEEKEKFKNERLNLRDKINKYKIKEKTKEETLAIIKNINQKRKQEILDFMLSNEIQESNLKKMNIQKKENKTSFLPCISKFNFIKKEEINSHCILISNDIIIIPTKDMCDEEKKRLIIYLFLI